jgi:ribosomal protein S18 acetylase RimI-like enzyme
MVAPEPDTQRSEEQVLDNPAWSALVGPHRGAAERVGAAARYVPEVSIFGGLDDRAQAGAWADAARLLGTRSMAVIAPPSPIPADWQITFSVACLQMVAPQMDGAPDDEAVRLGVRDVPEMLELVERTKPGPFLARTIELGDYLGIRRDGVLVAMAGERLKMPGWTEVSAVCTDESVRGGGLASRLVLAVVAAIRARGDHALLHVAAANTTAIRLYRSLGFVERKTIDIFDVRPPLTGAHTETNDPASS